jgi:hypothetical protein
MFFGLGAYLHDQPGAWNDLKGNLPSEMIGLAMSILAAVLVVGWIVDWHRQREWRSIRAHLAAAIAKHVADIASEFVLFLGPAHQGPLARLGAGRRRPAREAAQELDALIDHLRQLNPDNNRKAACELYEEVKWDLDRLTGLLLLRGLHAEDAQLAEAMSEVDARAADWHNAVVAERVVAIGSCLPQAVAVLEALRNLYALALRTAGGSPLG